MRRRLVEWCMGGLVLGGLAAFYLWHGGASALYLLLLAGMMVISGLLMQWLGPRGIRVKRLLPDPVITAGETAVMQVQLEFRSFLPVPWLAVEDYFTGGSSRQVLFPGFRRRLEYSYELCHLPRGVYSFEACLLEWGGLFGWFHGRRIQRSEGEARIRVLPRPLPIGETLELPSAAAQAALQPIWTAEHRSGAKSPEVRAYQPSDPLNRIDWKSSAKRGSLHAYVPEDERDPFCWVVLDRSVQGYASSVGSEEERQSQESAAFERAVSATAGILGDLMRCGVRSRLLSGMPDGADYAAVAAAGSGCGTQVDSREAYAGMLAALSTVKLTGETKLASLLEDVMRNRTPGIRIIVVTGIPDKPAAEAAACLSAQGMQVDFYCTALYANSGDTTSSRQAAEAGGSPAFAAALQLSRTGAGVFAVREDMTARVGLIEASPLGEGAV